MGKKRLEKKADSSEEDFDRDFEEGNYSPGRGNIYLRGFDEKTGKYTIRRIPMRDCEDVPKFIKRIMDAHEATKNSTLHFGGNYSSVRSPDYSPVNSTADSPEDYSQPPRA